MQESPEQVLARLVRYRDSLNGVSAPGTEFFPARERGRVQPAESSWRRARSAVAATVLGQFIAVVACAAAVVAFERLGTKVAFGVVVAAAAVGLIAAARRAPFALWWTIGVVIGGVLGRWS